MKNTSNVLALITARGGSRGIPKKNIVAVNGKPLIARTIEAAMAATTVGRCIVSTDCEEIAGVSRQYGAEVPFMRPKELAGDYSDHMMVVVNALEWLLDNEKQCPAWILLLQPTSPLRRSEDIDAAYKLAQENDADTIIGVSKLEQHPYFARTISKQGTLENFIDSPSGYLPRQKLPTTYHENGAIYLGRRDILLEKRTWYTEKTYPYIMPAQRSLDVNTTWDLYLASLVIRHPFISKKELFKPEPIYSQSTE